MIGSWPVIAAECAIEGVWLMAWDLVGDWQGTMSTDGLFNFPGLGASGGPPLTTNVLFRITA
jgi:hypothetical protein